MVAITRRLIALGRQRIVLLDEHNSLSNPATGDTAFLNEMTAHSITVGNDNIPGWDGGFEGF